MVNRRNKEKVAKAAVQITTDDDNAENEDLINAITLIYILLICILVKPRVKNLN